MIVVRFKVSCQPESLDDALKAFEAVVAPSRALEGVISFDIGQDLTDPNSIIATEVFEDRAALDRRSRCPKSRTSWGFSRRSPPVSPRQQSWRSPFAPAM